MKRWVGISAAATALVVIAGCGTASGAVPGPTTRHHAGVALTVRWGHALRELKPVVATLTVKPDGQPVLPKTGAMAMTDMPMIPLAVRWHQVKPGTFQGRVVPTMAGPWALSVTFSQGGRHWQETYPVTVNN